MSSPAFVMHKSALRFWRKGFVMKKSSAIGFGVFAMAAALGSASIARADTISFDIGSLNLAGPFPGPYEHVVVDRTSSTTATITFTSLTNGGFIYLMGDGGTVGVNVNAATWTLGPITGSNSGTGFTLGGPFSDGGSGNEDGFGSFNQTINTFDGFTHSSDTISFTLTDTSGTWASAANVLTPNSQGFEAAAHVFITSSPANASNGAIVTGFAAGSVPEPSTWAMMLLGFLGLGFAFRQSRRKVSFA
jgi:hypothetical protein